MLAKVIFSFIIIIVLSSFLLITGVLVLVRQL